MPNEWVMMNNINRVTFNDYLISVIKDYITKFDDIEKTVIMLPWVVTRMERYNIHKLTLRGLFEPLSLNDEHDDRVMEITLSKHYVQDLFSTYVFHSPIDVPKTEKQILFGTLMGFIQTNLSDEFSDYLKTI